MIQLRPQFLFLFVPFPSGQSCTAGSRIFVQEGIYDKFIEKFTAIAQAFGDNTGDPFSPTTKHGPQVSQTQYDVGISDNKNSLPIITFSLCLTSSA